MRERIIIHDHFHFKGQKRSNPSSWLLDWLCNPLLNSLLTSFKLLLTLFKPSTATLCTSLWVCCSVILSSMALTAHKAERGQQVTTDWAGMVLRAGGGLWGVYFIANPPVSLAATGSLSGAAPPPLLYTGGIFRGKIGGFIHLRHTFLCLCVCVRKRERKWGRCVRFSTLDSDQFALTGDRCSIPGDLGLASGLWRMLQDHPPARLYSSLHCSVSVCVCVCVCRGEGMGFSVWLCAAVNSPGCWYHMNQYIQVNNLIVHISPRGLNILKQ